MKSLFIKQGDLYTLPILYIYLFLKNHNIYIQITEISIVLYSTN